MRLFGRKAIITADTTAQSVAIPQQIFTNSGTTPALEFTCGNNGFDCQFDVHKDLTGKPNKATIQLFNLNSDHRSALSERAAKGPMRVRVDAGYEDGTARIFEGDLRTLYHDRHKADFITYFETGDGDKTVQTSRVFRSWGPGTPVTQVIRDVVTATGLGQGNFDSVASELLLEGLGRTFSQGTVVAGKSFDALERICRSAGISWSIQDGTLQFLAEGTALSGTAVLVTAGTGMLDTIKIDHKRRLHLKMLMVPDVFPGRKIQLEDKSVWRLEKCRYSGHTKGNNWNIDIEALPIKDVSA